MIISLKDNQYKAVPWDEAVNADASLNDKLLSITDVDTRTERIGNTTALKIVERRILWGVINVHSFLYGTYLSRPINIKNVFTILHA